MLRGLVVWINSSRYTTYKAKLYTLFLSFVELSGLDTLWNNLSAYNNFQTKPKTFPDQDATISDHSVGESKKGDEPTKSSPISDGTLVNELSENQRNSDKVEVSELIEDSSEIQIKPSNNGILSDTETTTNTIIGDNDLNKTEYEFNENSKSARTEVGINDQTSPGKTNLSAHGVESSCFIVENHQVSDIRMLNVEYQDSCVDQEDSIIQKSENLDSESKNWNTHECENLQQNQLPLDACFPKYSDSGKQSDQYGKENERDSIYKQYDNKVDKLRNEFKNQFDIKKQHPCFNNKTNFETSRNYDEYQSRKSTERNDTVQFNQNAFQRYFIEAYGYQRKAIQRFVSNDRW